jgi:hypothetical protein
MTHVTWVNKELFPTPSLSGSNTMCPLAKGEEAADPPLKQQQPRPLDAGTAAQIQEEGDVRRVYLHSLQGTVVAMEARILAVRSAQAPAQHIPNSTRSSEKCMRGQSPRQMSALR